MFLLGQSDIVTHVANADEKVTGQVFVRPLRVYGMTPNLDRVPVGFLGVTSLAAVAMLGLSVCGDSAARTSRPIPTARAAAAAPSTGITRRLVTASELPAEFAPTGKPTVTTSAKRWLQATDSASPGQLAAEASSLKRLGFVAGASENLKGPNGGGVSRVEEFSSSAGPRSEVASVQTSFKSYNGGIERFRVPGVPKAVGLGLSVGSGGPANVVFAEGRYYYLVGETVTSTPTQKQAIIGAAQKLYRRLYG